MERVARMLRDGISAAPGDLDHPGYEQLEALVDGKLVDVDREIIAAHLALCARCSEDVDDLKHVQATLAPVAPVVAPVRWLRPAVAAAAAAVVVLGIWIARQPAPSTNAPSVATSNPAPTAPAPAVDPLTSAERAIVDRVTAAGRLELPGSLAALGSSTGTLLGGAANVGLVPVGPLGTAVLAPRPAFTWQEVPGARAYTIAVFNDRFIEIARGAGIKTTTWSPGADLPRGQALLWQVTAHLAGSDVTGPAPPQPEARFMVVDEPTATSAGDQIARLADRPLALAILLAQAGLIEDARVQLRRATGDPLTATTARALLAQLSSR
jgi:hypothetical protein